MLLPTQIPREHRCNKWCLCVSHQLASPRALPGLSACPCFPDSWSHVAIAGTGSVPAGRGGGPQQMWLCLWALCSPTQGSFHAR